MAQNRNPNNNLIGPQDGPRTRHRKFAQQRVAEHHAWMARAFVQPDPPSWDRDRRFRPDNMAAPPVEPIPSSGMLRDHVQNLDIGNRRRPPDNAGFVQLRRYMTERFKWYRVGHDLGVTHPWASELWLRPEALLPRQAAFLRRQYKLKRRDAAPPGRFYTDQEKQKVTMAIDKVMPAFEHAPMTWKRFLGAGGMGLVALFEAKNRRRDQTKDVIVKMPLDGGQLEEDLLKEKTFYQIFQRAQHLVQQFDFQEFFGSGLNADHRLLKDNFPAIFLEYAKFDNLAKCLATSAIARKALPDVILWRILNCLVQGLIAMEYPPYNVESTFCQAEGRSMPLPGGKPLPEKMPTGPFQESLRSHLVHFDLDPQNILAAAGDEDPVHRDVPVFKIGDFGLTERVDNTFSARLRWQHRMSGKEEYYAPEQFCKQWDQYIDPVNEAKAQGEKVCAGDYSYKMNIWQAGMVMWCSMTLCHPQQPPIAEEVEITVPSSGEKKSIVSYGSSLKTMVDENTGKPYWETEEGEGYWGPQLVDMVIWMLAHYPQDRPTLAGLRNSMALIFNQQRTAEDDTRIKNWTAVACKEPPRLRGKPQVWAPWTIRDRLDARLRWDPFKDVNP